MAPDPDEPIALDLDSSPAKKTPAPKGNASASDAVEEKKSETFFKNL